jgi:hypothetical protein
MPVADHTRAIATSRFKAPLAMRTVIDRHAAFCVDGADATVSIKVCPGASLGFDAGPFPARVEVMSVALGADF